MFGRLRPDSRCISANERIDYQGEYCNLCGAISATYGFSSRMLVLYDFATLAWLLLDRPHAQQTYRRFNCVRGPRPARLPLSAADRFLAAVSVCACGIKIQDDIADERRLRSRVAARFYARTFETAEAELKECGFDVGGLQNVLAQQAEIERCGETGLDSASGPTGCAYALVARHLVSLGTPPVDADTAELLGEVTGRCVFLADAYRDYSKDIGKAYNPLVVDSEQRKLPQNRHRALGDYVAGLSACAEQALLLKGPELLPRWSRLWDRLRHLMQLERSSVTLNATCCIPCGDGAIAFDTEKDGEELMKCCGLLCCCLVFGSSNCKCC